MLRILSLLCFISVSFAADNSFAIVELFTSEGCSSCPPADKVANHIVTTARKENKNIFVLAFHVDYWDKLQTKHGVWKDPYSSNAHTKYQKEYANKNPMPGRKGMLVTPQILIDGDHIKTKQINFGAYLLKERNLSISQEITKKATEIVVTTSTKDAPDNTMLCVALVERGISSEIATGENHGKTLAHENIVRSFYRGSLKEAPKTIALSIPTDCDLKNCSVISYLQNNKTMHIIAATRSDTDQVKEKGQGLIVPIPKQQCGPGGCAVAIEDVAIDGEETKK